MSRYRCINSGLSALAPTPVVAESAQKRQGGHGHDDRARLGDGGEGLKLFWPRLVTWPVTLSPAMVFASQVVSVNPSVIEKRPKSGLANGWLIELVDWDWPLNMAISVSL